MEILLVLLRKEFILFWKNKFMPKVAFIFPCVVILIIPLVTTMDVRHVGVSAVNHDNSLLSLDIISGLSSITFFTVYSDVDYSTALERLKRGKCDVILEIPANFQKSIDEGLPNMPHISVNGVNGIKGTLGSRYVAQSIAGTLSTYRGMDIPELVSIQYMYNPTLEYRNNMIPALMIMLLIMICGFLPSLNLVSEKETGTIEQMNVTPVKTSIFVLSKVIPYWIIGMIVLSMAMLIATIVYGLAPAGTLGAIYLAAILFIFIMSGLGIIIANVSAKMSQSMFLMFFVVIIFVLMSGLLTPIASMPVWAQTATYTLPPRYFIEIMRSVYLKATSISDLFIQYIVLLVFAVITITLAALTYRKQQ